MRLMAGLDAPTAGRVLVDGDDVTGMPVRERNVAMVYQQFINYPSLTVYENIASPLRVRGVAEGRDRRGGARGGRAAAARALSRPHCRSAVRRPAAAHRARPRAGQERQAGAARRAAGQSRLQAARGAARPSCRGSSRRRGTIFVYATTEPSEALLLGGNTATLREGRVTQFGPTIEVYRQPKRPGDARIFSDPPMNLLTVKVEGRLGGQPTRPVDLPLPARCRICRRPLHGRLPRQPPIARSVRGDDLRWSTARSRSAEITGSESFVHRRRADAALVALAHGVHELELGQTVDVYLDPATVLRLRR